MGIIPEKTYVFNKIAFKQGKTTILFLSEEPPMF